MKASRPPTPAGRRTLAADTHMHTAAAAAGGPVEVRIREREEEERGKQGERSLLYLSILLWGGAGGTSDGGGGEQSKHNVAMLSHTPEVPQLTREVKTSVYDHSCHTAGPTDCVHQEPVRLPLIVTATSEAGGLTGLPLIPEASSNPYIYIYFFFRCSLG